MKKNILIILITLLPFATYAQLFTGGILLGINGSQVDGDQQAGFKKPGLLAGSFIKLNFAEKISSNIELYYIGKGAVLNQENSDGSVYQVFKTSLHYIEMPVLFCYRPIKRLSVLLGVAPAYLFKEKLFVDRAELPKEFYEMNNFDISIMGHLEFIFSEKISANIRYSYSLISIRKDVNWYNHNLSIVLRYTINKRDE